MGASKVLPLLGWALAVSAQINGTNTTDPGISTSTIYTTDLLTITSCGPTVTNCPIFNGSVIATSIPVAEVVYSTQVITITSCGPTVTNCPLSTTVIPVSTVSLGTTAPPPPPPPPMTFAVSNGSIAHTVTQVTTKGGNYTATASSATGGASTSTPVPASSAVSSNEGLRFWGTAVLGSVMAGAVMFLA